MLQNEHYQAKQNMNFQVCIYASRMHYATNMYGYFFMFFMRLITTNFGKDEEMSEK